MMKKALQVLVVEDNAGDARLLREMFSKEKPGSFELTHLLRMSEALLHLEKGGVDIVLLDMGLPDGHGLDTVRRAQAVAPGVPVIVLTGLDDEALAAEAMKEGAQDYLIKGQIESRALPRALRHAIERHRMQSETDLIRTNQMQFKDNFLSHVSHELRSPLNAIYQFVTILLDKLAGDLNPEQREYLEIVLRNVKQLQAMIHDLLEVTRGEGGKLVIELQAIPVGEAIADAVDTLKGAAAAKQITLSTDIAADLPLVCADPTRVRQILIILLDNAIKFTPANGSVTVRAQLLGHDPNLLVLQVSDTGCGIAEGMTERIFERLFQASDPAQAGRQGLGLGLHICKELVLRQGGRIWAMSTPGQGSVLSVTLPVFSIRNLLAPALKTTAGAAGPDYAAGGADRRAERLAVRCDARGAIVQRARIVRALPAVGTGCLSPQDGIVGRGGTLFHRGGHRCRGRRLVDAANTPEIRRTRAAAEARPGSIYFIPLDRCAPGNQDGRERRAGWRGRDDSNTRERGTYLKDGGKWLTK